MVRRCDAEGLKCKSTPETAQTWGYETTQIGIVELLLIVVAGQTPGPAADLKYGQRYTAVRHVAYKAGLRW